jgi:hypothetical protein
MLDLADIGEFSRHQAWWTVGRCGCGALGANRVCRFVVAGENGVRACKISWLLTHDARWMVRRTTLPMGSGMLQAGGKGVREGCLQGVLGAQVPGGEAGAGRT